MLSAPRRWITTRQAGFALLGAKRLVDLRRVEDGRIEDRVLADDPALGQAVASVRRLEEEHRRRLGALDPPERAARQHHVVPVAEREVAVVAEELAPACVDEEKLVTIAVSHQMIHPPLGLPQTQPQTAIDEKLRRR